MRKSVAVVVFIVLMASTCFGQQIELGPVGPDVLTFRYNPTNGDLFFRSLAGSVTTIELKSSSNQFTGVDNDALNGLFDVNSPSKVFKLEPTGFDDLNLPQVLPPGLSFNDLFSDLTLDGSFAEGGSLQDVPSVFIPEPSCLTLLACSGLGLLAFCRRKSRLT